MVEESFGSSVAQSLRRMRGVWIDVITVHSLQGEQLSEDVHSGTPGAAPFENIVYIDFDGLHYRQTNVTYKGRKLHTRSFEGLVNDGILHFSKLGEDDPDHLGVSGGEGVIIFCPGRITPAWFRYAEPDFIQLIGDRHRVRRTLLYRDGKAIRTLSAHGTKIQDDAKSRVSFDPRGQQGEVHGPRIMTKVFKSTED